MHRQCVFRCFLWQEPHPSVVTQLLSVKQVEQPGGAGGIL